MLVGSHNISFREKTVLEQDEVVVVVETTMLKISGKK